MAFARNEVWSLADLVLSFYLRFEVLRATKESGRKQCAKIIKETRNKAAVICNKVNINFKGCAERSDGGTSCILMNPQEHSITIYYHPCDRRQMHYKHPTIAGER